MAARRTLFLAGALAALVLAPAALFAQVVTTPENRPQGGPNAVIDVDLDGDGTVDYRVYYDRLAVVEHEELDWDYDGIMDTFYYYEKGTLVREEIDSNVDGKIDIWVYVTEGQYIVRIERDRDGDGKVDYVRDYSKG